MLLYKTTENKDELFDILKLQAKNLPSNLSNSDKKEQGFVTVHHSLEILQSMHNVHPHIIAIIENKLVGYALSMSKKFRNSIPVLAPMFAEIDNSEKRNANYIVMGQVCVDKHFRGTGVFRGLYTKIKEVFAGIYDCIITEIDVLNTRSINAHNAIGFKNLLHYKSEEKSWVIVFLDI